jgi:hypothetical protein
LSSSSEAARGLAPFAFGGSEVGVGVRVGEDADDDEDEGEGDFLALPPPLRPLFPLELPQTIPPETPGVLFLLWLFLLWLLPPLGLLLVLLDCWLLMLVGGGVLTVLGESVVVG